MNTHDLQLLLVIFEGVINPYYDDIEAFVLKIKENKAILVASKYQGRMIYIISRVVGFIRQNQSLIVIRYYIEDVSENIIR